MPDYCVVVVDGVRARLFSLETPALPEQGGPDLRERRDLISPELEANQADIWSDTKSGRNRGAGGSPAHGYDDHRGQHMDEFRRRFAREVRNETLRFVESIGARGVILAAQPRMLGFLKNEFEPLVRNGIEVRHVSKDLAKWSAHDIHQYLAREALLPPRRNAGI